MQMVAVTNWKGWARGAEFRENTFFALGTARFGHEIKRNQDGTYGLGPGGTYRLRGQSLHSGRSLIGPTTLVRSSKRLRQNRN